MTSQHSFSGTRRSLLISGASIAGLSVAPRLVSAATFPEAPIKIVVPFPPGGTVDTLGRIIAPTLVLRSSNKSLLKTKVEQEALLALSRSTKLHLMAIRYC